MGEYLGRKIPVEELIQALEKQYHMINGWYEDNHAEITALEKRIKQLHASNRVCREEMNKVVLEIKKLGGGEE